MPRVVKYIFFIFLLFSSPLLAQNVNNGSITASSGFLDLSSYDLTDHRPFSLNGMWEFRWKKLLLPGDSEWDDPGTDPAYYPVPLFWTAYEGMNLPSKGFGTYRLIIKTSGQNRNYGIKLPELFSEYRFWINGELVDQRWDNDGKSALFLKPSYHTYHTTDRILELILQIRNNSHHNAGIGQSIMFGLETSIFRQYVSDISWEIFLIAISFFAGLYHIIIYAFRKSEKELLYFGLFCLILAVRTFTTGNTLLTQIYPGISFTTGSRIATIVIPLAVIAFQTFAFYFFKDITPARIFFTLLGFHAVYFLLILTTTPMFYSTVYSYYLLVILITCLVIIGINIYGIGKHKQFSLLFFTGFLILFAGITNDMLHYLQIIITGYYLSAFFAGFILTESLMLAIKFSQEHKMVSRLSERLKTLDQLKDDFLARTSHELRTPLNGIIGITESLLDGYTGPLPEKVQYNLGLVASSGKRLYNLINDILDFSKMKHNDISLNMKPVDVCQVASVVIDVFKAGMPEKSLKIRNEIAPDIPPVLGDENRIQQIFYNLIGNAVKFTQQGYVKISVHCKEGFLEITVEDTGIGIPPEKQDSIFLSFEQGDSSVSSEYGGTGLGLPITKKLVELHGGTIEVISDKGEGASFRFSLPLAEGLVKTVQQSTKIVSKTYENLNSKEIAESEPRAIPEGSLSQGHILIVDDESVNIQVLSNHLSMRGFSADTASDGNSALDKIYKNHYDLVLLDLMMPRMSGFDVCREIRKQKDRKDLPVIILTAKNTPDDLTAAFEAGANDYLVKPIDTVELFARINTQLSLTKAVHAAIENAELANKDHLTGLFNRRYLMNEGGREFNRAKRYDHIFTVVMIDIDKFKMINDNYGHETGDKAIIKLAEILRSNIRSTDIAGRFGGDEFTLLLTDTNLENAAVIAEKIRSIVEKTVILSLKKEEIQFTISAGIAAYSQEASSFDEISQKADEMLYESKRKGRNTVLYPRLL